MSGSEGSKKAGSDGADNTDGNDEAGNDNRQQAACVLLAAGENQAVTHGKTLLKNDFAR